MGEREKTIAEIREALEKATPGSWKLVMDSYDDENDTHFPWMIINADGEEICDFSGGGDVKLENAHIMTNAPEWIRFLLEERNKLIDGLRWYADAKNYRREFRSRHGTLVEPAEAIYYDGGQRARNILKEIGVTVE